MFLLKLLLIFPTEVQGLIIAEILTQKSIEAVLIYIYPDKQKYINILYNKYINSIFFTNAYLLL